MILTLSLPNQFLQDKEKGYILALDLLKEVKDALQAALETLSGGISYLIT